MNDFTNLPEYARVREEFEAVAGMGGRACIASAMLNVDALLRAALAAATAAQSPADPLDTPLPCDVKVGHGTHKKGTSLRALVARMQMLYDAAQEHWKATTPDLPEGWKRTEDGKLILPPGIKAVAQGDTEASCERLRTGACGCTAFCGTYLGATGAQG